VPSSWNVVFVNNILRNRPDGSLTLATQTLLQNFKDLMQFGILTLIRRLPKNIGRRCWQA
jgi:hypothetical protein